MRRYSGDRMPKIKAGISSSPNDSPGASSFPNYENDGGIISAPIILALVQALSQAGADQGFKALVAGAGARTKHHPAVTYSVLGSWRDGDRYCVNLEFTNLTAHGAYVEGIKMTKPRDDLDLKARTNYKWLKLADVLPIYAASYGKIAITLGVADDRSKSIEKNPKAEFRFDFTVVGGHEAKTSAATAHVFLRGLGPKPEADRKSTLGFGASGGG